MSADLFAEFGSSSSQRPSQQQRPPSEDPFSFLGATSLSSTQPSASPAQPPQPSQPWPPFHQPPAASTSNLWGGLQGSQVQATTKAATADEDDGWGDFEVASPSFIPSVSASKSTPSGFPVPTQSKPVAISAPPLRTRVVRAPTLDMVTNSLVDLGSLSSGSKLETHAEKSPSPYEPPKQPPAPTKSKNADPNVLFDAEDFDLDGGEEGEDQDDEFGDFETVEPKLSKPASGSANIIDFMSADFGPPSTGMATAYRSAPPSQLLSTLSIGNGDSYPQAPKSPSFQDRNPFKGLAVTTPLDGNFPNDGKFDGPKKKEEPVTAWPSMETPGAKPLAEASPGWDWDAADGVEIAPPDAKGSTTHPPNHIKKRSSWDWDPDSPEQPGPKAPAAPTSKPAHKADRVMDDKAPPPTNVPPPSILLSIFPTLLDMPNEALFKPTTTSSSAAKGQVLANPATADFLRAYLVLATVAARIIAGRKQRWHRDRFLAQSMTISAAGGKGGMKLAGIDKTQAAREDREAADVVAVWRTHVGRLKAAVVGVNGSNGGQQQQLKVPELSEKPAVQTAKNVPTAGKACVICGLKRDERVKGVDFEVEDSFGEWWIDHWGHRACRNFWVEHEEQLRQR